MEIFDTIQDLRGRRAKSNVVALTRGGTSVGDGLHGIYIYQSNYTGPDDNYSAIVPTTSGNSGGWLLLKYNLTTASVTGTKLPTDIIPDTIARITDLSDNNAALSSINANVSNLLTTVMALDDLTDDHEDRLDKLDTILTAPSVEALPLASNNQNRYAIVEPASENAKVYFSIKNSSGAYVWQSLLGDGSFVMSVAGRTGVVTLTPVDVGLGAVSNTSDADKPVSTAQQSALDLKAPKASPAFTGIPTAPTATVTNNTTQLATTAFVKLVSDALVEGAPSGLNTLNKIATALNNDAAFYATITASINTRLAAADIINNLTQVATGKVLDAAQGKVLKDLVDGLSANSHTHSNITALNAVTGTNTGDETGAGIVTKLTALTGTNRLPATAVRDLPSGGGSPATTQQEVDGTATDVYSTPAGRESWWSSKWAAVKNAVQTVGGAWSFTDLLIGGRSWKLTTYTTTIAYTDTGTYYGTGIATSNETGVLFSPVAGGYYFIRVQFTSPSGNCTFDGIFHVLWPPTKFGDGRIPVTILREDSYYRSGAVTVAMRIDWTADASQKIRLQMAISGDGARSVPFTFSIQRVM